MAGKVTDFRKAEIWLLGYLVTFASKYKPCERGQMICSNSQDFCWGKSGYRKFSVAGGVSSCEEREIYHSCGQPVGMVLPAASKKKEPKG